MPARIFRPARTAMQSGSALTKQWVLEYSPADRTELDPLMGWTSSGNTQAQVRLSFETKEAAIQYARDHGIDATVVDPQSRQPVIRERGYGENFAFERRKAWTH